LGIGVARKRIRHINLTAFNYHGKIY